MTRCVSFMRPVVIFLTQGIMLVIRYEIFDPRYNDFVSFCEIFDFRYDIEIRVSLLTQGNMLVIHSEIF